MLEWIRTRGLIQHVPAVQLSIRLLVPPKSALLKDPDSKAWLGSLDAPNLTYCWDHPDALMDQLQLKVAQIAERAGNDNPYRTFAEIEAAAYSLAGKPTPQWKRPIYPHPV
jgi:hypothetical protein